MNTDPYLGAVDPDPYMYNYVQLFLFLLMLNIFINKYSEQTLPNLFVFVMLIFWPKTTAVELGQNS